MSWQEERARRRRARDMERQLQELDELDRRYGLGANPSSYPTPRRRRGGGGVLASLISTVMVLAVGAGAAFLLAPQLLTGARDVLDRVAGAGDVLAGGAYSDGMHGEAGTGGEGYTFALTQPDGTSPVTWPCTGTIPVEVNPLDAPEGYADLVATSVARVNEASGFAFEVVGETQDRGFTGRGPGPVLLGFADESEVSALAGPTAGLGGSVYLRERPGADLVAVGGMVVLDTDVFTDRLPAPNAEAILVHELVHVLGLGHTDARGELMRATNSGQTQLGPGDLAGLRHLRDQACS